MLLKLNYIIKDYKIQIYFLLLLLFTNLFLEIFTLASIIPILKFLITENLSNILIEKLSIFSKIENILNLKVLLISLFFIFYILKTSLYAYVNIAITKFTQNFGRNLSKKLYEKYLYSNYFFFNKKKSSDLIRNLTSEIDSFFSFVQNLLLIIVDTVLNLSIIIFLLYFNFVVTLSIIIFLIFFVSVFIFLTKNKLEKVGRLRIDSSSGKIKVVQETFKLIKEIKLFLKEGVFYKNYNFFNDKYRDAQIKFKIANVLPRPLIEIFILGILCIVILIALNLGLNLETIAIQTSVYLAAGLKIFPSTANFLVRFNAVMYRVSSVNLIYKEIKNTEKLSKENTKKNKVKFKNHIFLKDLSFNYPNSKKLFKNLHLKILKNKSYVLVGSNGAGKSTFLNLISGLLKPSDGEIYIDQISLNKSNSSLKNLIGYVPQDISLVDSSILFNITFLNDIKKVNKARLKKAIKYSNLEKIINSLPKKINSQVGENGAMLSGGQKQRVAIARAIYKNPSILLFDEATSDLDFESENNLIKTILSLRNKFTIIFITHNKNILKKFNYCLKIKNKKILIS